MKKNITIINSVAVNGGDEALLKATILGLHDKFEYPHINVLSSLPAQCKELFPEINFDWDWEYAFRNKDENENTFLYKIKKKTRSVLRNKLGIDYDNKLSLLLGSSREKRVYKKLKNSDFILCSPGGYLHDFYGYANRVSSYNFFIEKLSKDVHVFGQSVGPFFLNIDRKELLKFLRRAKSISLRESYSKKYINELASDIEVRTSVDIAFYLRKKFYYNVKFGKTKNIVLCFRKWLNDDFDSRNKEKAIVLIEKLVDDYGCNLTFISTCQGIDNYKDDSEFAYEIIDGLSEAYKPYCSVVSKKMKLEELVKKLNEFDAYIGMRLHGAILSMIAGIPALNIGYEDKTRGIYEEMKFNDYCLRFEEPIEIWLKTVEVFFRDQDKIKQTMPSALDDLCDKAEESFNVFNPYL
ncbi:polysaccharide pyruvyl transferase family protein [Algibacter mikhailovii]|uniref:polysaccharide pyruvyl transferase family protein n=1 Tax=Algibacter mikhailovii TaxID=425498 RepID=UPI002494F7E3|nr:polysaccharide pyruvyl transferase family protein [Algibacter mikhailovii]